jgi:hypothetical protein
LDGGAYEDNYNEISRLFDSLASKILWNKEKKRKKITQKDRSPLLFLWASGFLLDFLYEMV